MNSETPKRKRYDEAFKRSAVEHWMLSGQSATQIARIGYKRFYREPDHQVCFGVRWLGTAFPLWRLIFV